MSKYKTFSISVETDESGNVFVVDGDGRVMEGVRCVSVCSKINEPVELSINVLVDKIEVSGLNHRSGIGRVAAMRRKGE